jgi:UDP-N-acetylmuramyl tripeptide synthase
VHSTAEWSAPLTLNVAGDFNALNALCAIGCALHLGSTGPAAVASLSTFTGTPGRLERISAGQDFHVFVDFTVTPASYEATLSTLRASLEPGKRLLVVMGSCGDRMREKRPQIATVASRFADVIVVTNEDPYTEDPERIISEVWAGLDLSRVQAERISDRRTAIARTFQLARPGDIVVLCGKGSDTTMWTAQGKIPWDDRAIARELLHEGQIPR